MLHTLQNDDFSQMAKHNLSEILIQPVFLNSYLVAIAQVDSSAGNQYEYTSYMPDNAICTLADVITWLIILRQYVVSTSDVVTLPSHIQQYIMM